LEYLRENVHLFLAIGEQVAPSMNGASLRRLSALLDQYFQLGESAVDECDREWLRAGAEKAKTDGRIGFWRGEVERLASTGVRIIPCVDPQYPVNLAMVHDRPPFLFVRGEMTESDSKAVAVVGMRQASERGLEIAFQITSQLATDGFTIISGLASGIDTAAHKAALEVGGRSIAVFGTSIEKVYPAQNRALADELTRSGACVSQFLPTVRTGPWCFPARNVTTSGLSLGTIVVEASRTSGAKMQAEAALAHGKQVFLVEELTNHQAWASELARHTRTTVASTADEIIQVVQGELGPRENRFVSG
jgi:DNA processing protein